MFPIESPPLQKRILKEILPAYLRDNVRARQLNRDGNYIFRTPAKGEATYRCQQELLQMPTMPEFSISSADENGQETAAGKAKEKKKKKRARAK